MSWIDWSIVAVYLTWIVASGVRYRKQTTNLEEFVVAGRSMPWWAVGLSVMATQMSAVTLVGTTGQAYEDGMRFLQFYFGLPLAMIILSVTVVPFFFRARVYTAYEYLERRFDAKTRSLTSFFFLVSRCLGVGVIISAPAIVLSAILGWPLAVAVFAIGLSTTLYTMFGGVRAVTWTDVRQMVVVSAALVAVVFIILNALPTGVGIGDALETAAITGRTAIADFSFDWNEKYTVWSGLIGGLFLFLSYFGCDQSQVQRYLAAKSIDAGRRSLWMNGVLKIPLQFVILLVGVLVFVFYHYTAPPLVHDPVSESALVAERPDAAAAFTADYTSAFEERRRATESFAASRSDEASEMARAEYMAANEEMKEIRASALAATREVIGDDNFRDVNFVFPRFVTTHLPIGIIGLFIAAIFAAAMSSISSELNALATATVIDFYRRHARPDETDKHYLKAARVATLGWGLFACVVGLFAADLGSLIEVVNTFGSFFYGSLLGVFVLAIGTKRATGRGAFWGLLAGISSIAILNNLEGLAGTWQSITGSDALYAVASSLSVSYLWYNVIGCLVVVVVGLVISGRRKDGSATLQVQSGK